MKHLPFQSRLLLAATLVALFQVVSAVSASCVYNYSAIYIEARLNYCGVFCNDLWKLNPGESACDPGQDGIFQLLASNNEVFGHEYWQLGVDGNGYVALYTLKDNSVSVCAFTNEDVQRECFSFEPYEVDYGGN